MLAKFKAAREIAGAPTSKNLCRVYTEGMKYEVLKSQENPGAYLAVASNKASQEETYLALFSGPEAKKRAEEYAAWKNSQMEVTGEQLLRR